MLSKQTVRLIAGARVVARGERLNIKKQVKMHFRGPEHDFQGSQGNRGWVNMLEDIFFVDMVWMRRPGQPGLGKILANAKLVKVFVFNAELDVVNEV